MPDQDGASGDGPVTGRDAWDRLGPLWHLLVAGTVALPTAITLLVGTLSTADRITVAALVVGFAVWHWLLLIRDPRWAQRSGPVVVYWVGAAVFATLLVGYGDTYTIMLYGFYPLAFVTLGWWGMVPVVGMTALLGWRLGVEGPATWVNLLATSALALVIAVVVNAVARQSEQRRAALEELAATRAELAETARRSGVLEERQRLAREMHDTVAQGFTSIVTHLEAADQALPDDAEVARTHLDTARRTAREGLGEVRRSVQALRPDLLEGASLGQALQRTVDRWSAEHGLTGQLRVTGDPVALHPDTETALLRTAQEALTNTAKHAEATRAVVTLSYLGDTVTLDVDDDGTGFHPGTVPNGDGGFGLVGMRERVTAVGGKLDVESAPGEGTTVAASVPS